MSELNNIAPQPATNSYHWLAREISEETVQRMAPREIEAIVADVAERLGQVRGDLGDSEFVDLVRTVVRTKIRFSELDTDEFAAPIPEFPPRAD